MIVLDPGHGGEKDGVLSVEGRREKDITLQIARQLKKRLERQGARAGAHAGRRRERGPAAPRRHRQRRGGRPLRLPPPQLRRTLGPRPAASRPTSSADATDDSASAVAARRRPSVSAPPTPPNRAESRRPRGPGQPRRELPPGRRPARCWCAARERPTWSEAGPLPRAGRRAHGRRAARVGLLDPVEGKELARPARQETIAGAIAAGIAGLAQGRERRRGHARGRHRCGRRGHRLVPGSFTHAAPTAAAR